MAAHNNTRIRAILSTLARPRVALPLTLLVALAVRLWAFVGICRLDMFRYLELSHHVLEGGSLFDPQVFYASARLPLMLPLIVSNAVGGYGEHVSVMWPLLCSLATVMFTYLLALDLFNRTAALASGLLMACFPLEIELGTQLLPDPIKSAFVVAAVYFGVHAIKHDRLWGLSAVLSGFSLAVAYYTRVNAIILLPGLLLLGTMLDTPKWRRSLWTLFGLAAAFAAFAVVFWIMSGDPFVDIHKSQAFYASYEAGGFIERKATFLALLRSESSIAWLIPLAILGGVGALRILRRPSLPLVVWAVGFFVYLEWVSPLHGLDSSYRYVEPLVAPVVILAAATLVYVARSLSTWRYVLLAVTLTAALVSLSLTGAQLAHGFRSNPRWASLRPVARMITASPDVDLYVDHPWLIYSVNYYSSFALERDTLEPPSASVNDSARLFTIDERSPSESNHAWMLVSSPGPDPEASTLLKSFSFPHNPLKLFEIE